MKNKKGKIIISITTLLLLVFLALGITYFLRSRKETSEEEVTEKSGEEILFNVYGVLPVSGKLEGINFNERYLVINEDGEESRYYYPEDMMCEQIGKPGQDCLAEDEECNYESVTCNVEDIKISEILGVDLDLNSKREVELMKVYYIAQ